MDSVPGYEMLRVAVGSTLYGISIGSGDRDLMGITVEPANAVFGLANFDQYESRTAAKGEQSGPDDTDLVVYGLKKWMRLAAKGNPSVLMALFAPPGFTEHITPFGEVLRALTPAIVSQRCRGRFLGYLGGQRRRAEQEQGSGHGRREGREAKWASHMVRLGYQAEELLTTGRLTLPMPVKQAEVCKAVRRGEVPLNEALRVAREQEEPVERITDSPLAPEPELLRIEAWMQSVYLRVHKQLPATP